MTVNDVVVKETLREAVDCIDFSTSEAMTREQFSRALALKEKTGWPDARCSREVGIRPATFRGFLRDCEEAREAWDEARERGLQRYRDSARSALLEIIEDPEEESRERRQAAQYVLDRTDEDFKRDGDGGAADSAGYSGMVGAPVQVNLMIVNQGIAPAEKGKAAVPTTITVLPEAVRK